jgi:Zn-dependent peptidase ImmA (M78 family)
MTQPTTSKKQRSVLASLRALVPKRPLTAHETLRIAELQANKLLEHFNITTVAVPAEIVSELPRIRVVREPLPVSGSAHWTSGYWLITLNSQESAGRQRFSLVHEFKHVLDHTTKQYLYRDRSFQTAHQQAERVADYFAACLLMPKKVVVRLWCGGHQNIMALAEKLQVSPAALRYRLDQLGLTDSPARCFRLTQRSTSRSSLEVAA